MYFNDYDIALSKDNKFLIEPTLYIKHLKAR